MTEETLQEYLVRELCEENAVLALIRVKEEYKGTQRPHLTLDTPLKIHIGDRPGSIEDFMLSDLGEGLTQEQVDAAMDCYYSSKGYHVKLRQGNSVLQLTYYRREGKVLKVQSTYGLGKLFVTVEPIDSVDRILTELQED